MTYRLSKPNEWGKQLRQVDLPDQLCATRARRFIFAVYGCPIGPMKNLTRGEYGAILVKTVKPKPECKSPILM